MPALLACQRAERAGFPQLFSSGMRWRDLCGLRSFMDFVVLGAGMMGRAVVYDLARARDVRSLTVADFDLGRGLGNLDGGRRGLRSRMCARLRNWRGFCAGLPRW